MSLKTFFGLIIILIAAGVQLELKKLFPWTIDLVLSALIVIALIFDAEEAWPALLLGPGVLLWRPGSYLMPLLVLVLPAAVYVLKKQIAWKGPVVIAILIAASIIVFHLFFSPAYLLVAWKILIIDLVVAVLFGEALFLILDNVYPLKKKPLRIG